MSLTIKTPAKINLGLRVVNQRPDGYHRIRTIFQTIDLYDQIQVRRISGDTDRLITNGPIEVESDSSNLVITTLNELRKEGIDVPTLEIKLYKKIPLQSGLGGGSSNAAGILRFLSALMDDWSYEELDLSHIAHSLGADVPFFLKGGTVLGEGIGQSLYPLQDQEGMALLVVPSSGVSTEEAYEYVEPDHPGVRPSDLQEKMNESDYAWKNINIRNDFEEFMYQRIDNFERIWSVLKERACKVGLSGSGSTIYGLFECLNSMESAYEKMDQIFNEAKLFRTNFLGEYDLPKIKSANGS